TYGLLEIGIGISATLVPVVFRSLNSLYWAITPAVTSIPGGGVAVRFLSSFVVLVIPTFLMGGTLPMLSRFFLRHVHDVERRVGVLYGLNTFGAAAGTILAALYLVPGMGNRLTTIIIASMNLAIGALAIWMDKKMAVPGEGTSSRSTSKDESSDTV